MGQPSSTDARTTNETLLARSTQSLRRVASSLGGAAALSAIAAVETAARELSKAERLRRRRQREREEAREEREAEREERRRRRRDDDDDDGDDDDGDRISQIRAKHTALLNRNNGERQVNARQSADDGDAETAAERRARRQAERDNDDGDDVETAAERRARRRAERDDADGDADNSDDEPTVTETRQMAPNLGLSGSSNSSSGSTAEEIRVGDSSTWASIDPNTGTATAFSNGVSAIAGPDGADIQGSPSSSGTGTSVGRPSSSLDDSDLDGNDDGDFDELDDLDDGFDDGGNNDDDLLS